MVFQGFDTVMFGDVDASGLGHFAHQVRFLERAEFQFMNHVKIVPREWFMRRYLFPRVKLEVDYTAPLYFGDDVRMDVQVGHLGNTSYSLVIEVVNLTSSRRAMWARLVVVLLDPATHRPTPLPPELRDAFAPYLVISDMSSEHVSASQHPKES